MRLGALLSFNDGTNPNAVTEEARRFEAEGFDSIWSAQAMGRGFMLMDPFIALSAVAAVTERVEIGTAILQLPIYNPVDIALKSWSLQQISGGRFILGIGVGSTESDFKIHGVNYKQRASQFEQSLGALRLVFETGQVGGTGLTPWPGVKRGPTIFYGTWGKNVARAAGEFDGWIASGMHRSPSECAEALVGYRKAGGRRAVVSTIQVSADVDLGELRDKLCAYKEAGFDDAVVMFMPGAPLPAEVRALV